MAAILVDSQKNLLLIPMAFDDDMGGGRRSTIKAIDYFTICEYCHNPVLDASSSNDGNDQSICDVCRTKAEKTTTPSRFTFNLKFDNAGTEDLINVADSEVSRILSDIVDHDISATDILLDIMSSRFYLGGGTPNLVIKTMLNFFIMDPKRRSVSYCFDCDKYVMGSVNETICAYDTVGQADSHRTFHIDIIETALPSIETICHDAIMDLKGEIIDIQEGLTCSREFINKIVDIACSAHAEAENSGCSRHHACGTEPGEHNCSCIRK
jgi:hypothetical protein